MSLKKRPKLGSSLKCGEFVWFVKLRKIFINFYNLSFLSTWDLFKSKILLHVCKKPKSLSSFHLKSSSICYTVFIIIIIMIIVIVIKSAHIYIRECICALQHSSQEKEREREASKQAINCDDLCYFCVFEINDLNT